MTASIISLSHRVHEDDLTSHLVKQGFRHIVLPFEATQDERWECNGEIYIRSAGDILQPGRWPPDFKGALLTHIYLTQYQQAPTAIGSGILTRDHFPIAQACPSGGQVIVSWDIASSKREGSSYSVGLAFRVVENAAYLIKIIRGRFDYTKLRDLAQDIDTMYGPMHLIEATSLGVALSDDLIKAGANVLPIKVGSASKEQRLEAVINKIEIRFVRPILDIENLEDFYNEITSFPNGKHNDCVDALTQLLNWLRENPPSPRRPLVTLGAGKIRGFHPNPAESRTSRGRRF
jgi:phage terminase large subunit-like protein